MIELQTLWHFVPGVKLRLTAVAGWIWHQFVE
jgi:hypothetical protein